MRAVALAYAVAAAGFFAMGRLGSSTACIAQLATPAD